MKITDSGYTAATQTRTSIPVSETTPLPIEGRLEDYALPDWFAQYLPPMTNLTLSSQAVREGQEYVRMADRLSAAGELSHTGRKALQQYLENAPATQQLRKFDEQRANLREQLNEFGTYHEQAYRVALAAVGASNTREYNLKVAEDPAARDQARAAFEESLFGNPGMKELMGQLGIGLVST